MSNFPSFPPGPRWFVGLRVEAGRVGIAIREGQHDTNPAVLEDLDGSHAVYVFATPIAESDLVPVVQAMFDRTGPTMVEVFQDRIETMYMAIPTAPLPEGVRSCSRKSY